MIPKDEADILNSLAAYAAIAVVTDALDFIRLVAIANFFTSAVTGDAAVCAGRSVLGRIV